MSVYGGFNSVELRKPTRSKFDLSHEKRLSTRMGRLTPVFISETLPNDTFRCNTEVMLRLAPLLAPIMHRVNVYVHYFFVPNRLLWEDWEDFITNGRLGTETPPVPPNTEIVNFVDFGPDLLDEGSLFDYLGGVPITDTDQPNWNGSLDCMPFAVYYKAWYDYYRDRNFHADNDELPLPSGDCYQNLLDASMCDLRNRCWEHDYFTSSLPWTQRGAEVLMPLQGTGSVTYFPTSLLKTFDGSNVGQDVAVETGASISTGVREMNFAPSLEGRVENIDEVTLDSSDVSINDLRRAIALQSWLERNALAGSRYNESIYAHFARRTSDGRLQRAEYLGGGKVTIKISEVVSTAWSVDGSSADVPQGNMAGHGISFGNTNQFTYNCEEHGFIIGIMSVMPTSGYMQGIPRMFLQRNTFLDYPFPSFAHLGEQEVFKYELFANPTNAPAVRADAPVFGYNSRYVDWKNISSSSHGDFRSTLDYWHLTRKFASSPTLGETFNTFEDALQDRIFAVSNVDTLWCYIYNQCSVVRSLPYFGTPQLRG